MSGDSPDAQAFAAAIERHHPDLPVYLIVPADSPAAFGKQRTFVVEAAINGSPVAARSAAGLSSPGVTAAGSWS
jgi:hypothetical protein